MVPAPDSCEMGTGTPMTAGTESGSRRAGDTDLEVVEREVPVGALPSLRSPLRSSTAMRVVTGHVSIG